jgi:hypothetical protein
MNCRFWFGISRTTLLTADGKLFCAGQRDIEMKDERWDTFEYIEQLGFPDPGILDEIPMHKESTTFIRQFSACEHASRAESRILGLSASGHIWFWSWVMSDVHCLRLRNNWNIIDPSRVKSVAASSSYGAAYVTGKGIVYWERPDPIFDVNHGDNNFSSEHTKFVSTSTVPEPVSNAVLTPIPISTRNPPKTMPTRSAKSNITPFYPATS